jgi:hypothetical protein
MYGLTWVVRFYALLVLVRAFGNLLLSYCRVSEGAHLLCEEGGQM